MPCILPSGELNGISVPAICARHGGQWVGEQQPSLMSQPTSDNSYSGSGFPAAGTPHPNQPSTYSDGEGGYWSDNPVENLTPWLIPGAGTAKSTATYLGTKVLPKVLPKVKSVAQSLFTKPGQVQKTVPIIKKVSPAVTKNAGTLMKPIPSAGQKMATKKITTDGRVISAPGVIGGGLVAAPIVKSIFSDEPVTDKKVVNQTAKGTPWADLAKGVKPDARDDMAFEGALMNNPEAIKEMAKSDIPDSIWDKMQTKGFWMDGVEGGAGKWDNKLFRLGEMMSYMGTPLSKRGDSPAKRWTSANTEASKIKQAISKASGVANSNLTKAEQVEKWKLISASEVPESVLADLFYNKGMFDSDADAKRNAAGAIGVYKSVRSKLLEAGRTPTHQDVLAEMKRLRGTKI